MGIFADTIVRQWLYRDASHRGVGVHREKKVICIFVVAFNRFLSRQRRGFGEQSTFLAET